MYQYLVVVVVKSTAVYFTVLSRTEILRKSHWSMRILNPLLLGLFYPFLTSPEQCGEYMLYSLLQSGEGVNRRGTRGDDLGKSPLYDDEEKRKRLWEHTKEEVERAIQNSTAKEES